MISMGAPAFPPRHGVSLAPQSLVVHMLYDVNMRLHPTASTTADQLCMGVAGDAPQALSITGKVLIGTGGEAPLSMPRSVCETLAAAEY